MHFAHCTHQSFRHPDLWGAGSFQCCLRRGGAAHASWDECYSRICEVRSVCFDRDICWFYSSHAGIKILRNWATTDLAKQLSEAWLLWQVSDLQGRWYPAGSSSGHRKFCPRLLWPKQSHDSSTSIFDFFLYKTDSSIHTCRIERLVLASAHLPCLELQLVLGHSICNYDTAHLTMITCD